MISSGVQVSKPSAEFAYRTHTDVGQTFSTVMLAAGSQAANKTNEMTAWEPHF